MLNLSYVLPLLFSSSSSSSEGSATSPIYTILMIVALFAVMYFVMIRPQRKKQKEEQDMRDAIQIGDEITTIGGIMGRVVTVKDDSLVIETGADRIKMKIGGGKRSPQTGQKGRQKRKNRKESRCRGAQSRICPRGKRVIRFSRPLRRKQMLPTKTTTMRRGLFFFCKMQSYALFAAALDEFSPAAYNKRIYPRRSNDCVKGRGSDFPCRGAAGKKDTIWQKTKNKPGKIR